MQFFVQKTSRGYQAQFGDEFNVKNKRKYHAVLSLSLLDDHRERVTLKRGSVIQMQDQPEQIVVELRGFRRRTGRFEYMASVVSRLGPSTKITRSVSHSAFTRLCMISAAQARHGKIPALTCCHWYRFPTTQSCTFHPRHCNRATQSEEARQEGRTIRAASTIDQTARCW